MTRRHQWQPNTAMRLVGAKTPYNNTPTAYNVADVPPDQSNKKIMSARVLSRVGRGSSTQGQDLTAQIEALKASGAETKLPDFVAVKRVLLRCPRGT
jgi:hypothetical protein